MDYISLPIERQKKLAVLIDADNAQACVIKNLLDEVASTRTPNLFHRIAAPVVVILLGISWQMNYNTGSVVATSALVAAPVAAFIPPFLFGRGRRPGLNALLRAT